MLTFILLAVLAGGVGLVAVSAAERNDPATPRVGTRRGDSPRRAKRSRRSTAQGSDGRRRRGIGDVPRGYTAVEGSFAAVAMASPGRRAMSLAAIVAISAAVAVAIAASIGLSAAAVWRVLDSAIG